MLALVIEFSRSGAAPSGAVEGSHPQDRTVCLAGLPRRSARVPLPRLPGGVLTELRRSFFPPNSQWIDWSLRLRRGRPPRPVRVEQRKALCQWLLRKEVIQPHLPVRLPCYDFTPIADPTFDGSLHKGWATGFGCYPLSWCDGRCVQGPGTYSPRRC